jgi:hypothetical protein
MSSLWRWSIALLISCAANAQTEKAPASEVAGIPVNYDEAKVGTYTLPDPLVLADGKPVRDGKTWNEKRRPEIVRLFEENQYGRAPGRPAGMSFEVLSIRISRAASNMVCARNFRNRRRTNGAPSRPGRGD